MITYDVFIEKVNEAGFYTPFVNYIDFNDFSSDIERNWRIKATHEKKLACGYFFNGKPGYIAPRFLSIFIDAFKPCMTIEERYKSGNLSKYERDIWSIINKHSRPLSLTDIRKILDIKSKSEQGKLETAIRQLHITFDIAICGGVDTTLKNGEYAGQILGYDKIENCIPMEWIELNPRMEHEAALQIIYRQAEKISKIGEAKKAFNKSLKLYKAYS
jgi:hypothetical protein